MINLGGGQGEVGGAATGEMCGGQAPGRAAARTARPRRARSAWASERRAGTRAESKRERPATEGNQKDQHAGTRTDSSPTPQHVMAGPARTCSGYPAIHATGHAPPDWAHMDARNECGHDGVREGEGESGGPGCALDRDKKRGWRGVRHPRKRSLLLQRGQVPWTGAGPAGCSTPRPSGWRTPRRRLRSRSVRRSRRGCPPDARPRHHTPGYSSYPSDRRLSRRQ